VIWGALHGAALAIHKLVSPLLNFKSRAWNIISLLFTFHFVCFCWIFFRAADLTIVGQVLTQIFNHFNGQIFFDFITGYKAVMFLIVVGYILHFIPNTIQERAEENVINMSLLAKAICVVAVIVLVIQTKSAGVQPFIYFQF